MQRPSQEGLPAQIVYTGRNRRETSESRGTNEWRLQEGVEGDVTVVVDRETLVILTLGKTVGEEMPPAARL